MMRLVKINVKRDGEDLICYNRKELIKFFEKAQKLVKNELGKRYLKRIVEALENPYIGDIWRISVTERVPVEKGYCPGINTILKSTDSTMELKDVVRKLNGITRGYSGDRYYLCVNLRHTNE